MIYNVSTKQITETVAPAAEPVTLAQMKTHLRVDGTDSDTLISLYITAARQWVETHLQRSLVQRTYRADLVGFYDYMVLPLPPLASVTNVKYYDTASPMALTTLADTTYRVDLSYNRIYRDYGASWPAVNVRHDAVQITYVAGYAPSSDSPISDHAANVPEAIKQAIKLRAADFFENRETNTPLKITQLPTIDNLLAAYREY